jgi:anti-sigma regulatory factor (Ser/Thr protein kinase)
MFSDGIYECSNQKGEQFGISGVLHALKNYIQLESCVSLPYRIKQYLTENNYNISADDFTLFAFQKRKHHSNSEPVTLVKGGQAVHYTTSLQSALREVGKTSQHCEELVMNWNGSKTLAAKAELIVDEFLNNIIKYGYKYADDASIVVEFKLHDNQLVIKFWDRGIEWSPEIDKLAEQVQGETGEDYRESGRGVEMIVSMASRFHRARYGQLNETTVEITL